MRVPKSIVATALGTCVVAASAFVSTSGAAADASLKVLRHMTFDVTFDSESSIATKASGMDAGLEAGRDHGAASGTSTSDGPNVDRKGLVTVDVVAATADGGLAVDVSQERAGPTARVGITATSQLLADRGAALTEEERALLRFLARGFVKADVLSAGVTWTDASPDPELSERTTYRVVSVDDTAKTIVIAIDGSSSTKGPNSYTAQTTGTMTYDTAKVVPVSFELSTKSEVESSGRLETIVDHINSKLRDDSMRAKS